MLNPVACDCVMLDQTKTCYDKANPGNPNIVGCDDILPDCLKAYGHTVCAPCKYIPDFYGCLCKDKNGVNGPVNC